MNGVARITALYTPNEHRHKGYAASALAALSNVLGKQGYRRFLFVNLANGISDHIVRSVGYRGVYEMASYDFGV